MKRKIETAKNMLVHSEFTSAEISDYLAFSSQSYFIRAFKKLTGMTPLEYQKKYFNRGIRAASVNLEKK